MVSDVTNKVMVAGFLFHRAKVLLVRKTRPEWQKNLWNGVGGVVEKDETPLIAMRREFVEEAFAGMTPAVPIEWKHFCTEIEPFGAYVHFFKARIDEVPPHAGSNDVGEPLTWFNWRDVCGGNVQVVGNLRWLVALALEWREHAPVVVDVQSDIREKASW